jgi:hypothetical protein
MFVILIGTFMALLDSSVVNVALPKIMTVFGAGTEDVEWVSTTYTLVLGVVETLSGWLGNRLGLKHLYIFSMATFAFGSLDRRPGRSGYGWRNTCYDLDGNDLPHGSWGKNRQRYGNLHDRRVRGPSNRANTRGIPG